METKISKEWMTNFLKTSPAFLSEFVMENVALETLYECKAEKQNPQKGKFMASFKPFKILAAPGNWKSQLKVKLQPPPPLATADVGVRKTISDLAEFIDDHDKKQSRQLRRKTTGQLTKQQQEELFFELIIDIAHELAVDALCYKILANVNMLTGSDRGSLFLVRVNNKGEPYLESKLFDVKDPAGHVCTPMQEGGILIEIPFGKGIAGIVAQSKKAINVADAYKDERFNQDIDHKTGYHTKSLLTLPIFNYEGSVIGVAQIMNKQGGDELFTELDKEVFEKFLVFCGISLTNAELFGLSLNEFKMNKLLLMLAKDIFAEQSKLESLAKRIMLDIQNIISCKRCILYLINFIQPAEVEVEISKAFDMIVSDKTVTNPSEDALRKFPATGFALNVAKSGQPDEFDAHNVDANVLVSDSGYAINSVLSMPVFDMNNKVVGVVQMINKANNERFNPSDVKTVTTFALFCGLGICNCRAYENMVKMIARQRVNLDVLSYYATASDSETEDLEKAAIVKSQKLKLGALDFSDASLNDFETCKAVLAIFTELDIINRFKIESNILCRWILSVKKNYRPALYHNWRHAFSVVQMMFYCLTVGQLTTVLSDLEVFVMIVAALCHDLDYRPDTSRVKLPLAMLYSTVSAEHHYIDQCIMLLNNEKTNIFCNLGNDEYKIALEMLEDCILSTDLTLYYKRITVFQELVYGKMIDWTVDANRSLLRSMLMVATDVSASCKPWAVHFKSTNLVFSDFVRQNEETTAGSKFLKVMASTQKKVKDELPKLQLGFMDSVCLPLYTLLINVFPLLKPMYDVCLENRAQWKKLGDEATRRTVL